MKQGKKLLILPAVAILLGMGTGCFDNSKNKAQDMARKALMASVDNPERLSESANRTQFLAVSMLP